MLNLSLSGCGFLGIYHIGVISAFKEHAPEVILNKITGCSAGALVAACAVCDCCLGQMVGDVLEIALKARDHALGPLHPSFSIVEILRSGLRRILPIDAHRICSGKVLISLTRWKDGKNVLVSQFDTREELIQALICSSFIPMYSGFLPPKFKGSYYWDGGLSNNNPIIDEHTITVSPFGGESDICPRLETGSYFTMDFNGTNIQLSSENIYRISKALFPPSPEILKAICFRGYKDGIAFLKTRNLLYCSCYKFKRDATFADIFEHELPKMRGIKSDINSNIINNTDTDEKYYSSNYEDEMVIKSGHSSRRESTQSLDFDEMPTSVCEVLDAACDDDKGFINYLYYSRLSRVISIFMLPWTLPLEFTFIFTKKLIRLIPKSKETYPEPSNLLNTVLIYLNYLKQRLIQDKYQYHAKVTCKLCLVSSLNDNRTGGAVCHHRPNFVRPSIVITKHTDDDDDEEDNDSVSDLDSSSRIALKHPYFPKLCPRHRVPSVCDSDHQADCFEMAKSHRRRYYTSNTESEFDDHRSELRPARFLKKRRRTSISASNIL